MARGQKQKRSYEDRIKLRVMIYWALWIFINIYMIVIAELGLADSRVMTQLADFVTTVIVFGGLGYCLYSIYYYKKLLRDRSRLQDKAREEADERRRFLHDKSGGRILDILIPAQIFITCTAGVTNMPAFNTAFVTLVLVLVLKLVFYLYYDYKY